MMSLYLRAHKYLAFLGIPMVVYAVLISRRFVELWVGPSLSVIAIPFCALLIVNFLNLTTGPGFLILMGRGRLRPGLYSAILGIVLNITLSFVLIRAYGFAGAIIGTSVSLTVASIYFLLECQRETGISLVSLMRSAYLKPLVTSLVIAGVLWGLSRPLAEISWVTLTVGAVVFGTLYLLALLLLRFFDGFDLAIVERAVRLPSFVRRMVPNAELGGALLPHRESPQAASQ